jgi:hypothetical protein
MVLVASQPLTAHAQQGAALCDKCSVEMRPVLKIDGRLGGDSIVGSPLVAMSGGSFFVGPTLEGKLARFSNAGKYNSSAAITGKPENGLRSLQTGAAGELHAVINGIDYVMAPGTFDVKRSVHLPWNPTSYLPLDDGAIAVSGITSNFALSLTRFDVTPKADPTTT